MPAGLLRDAQVAGEASFLGGCFGKKLALGSVDEHLNQQAQQGGQVSSDPSRAWVGTKMEGGRTCSLLSPAFGH